MQLFLPIKLEFSYLPHNARIVFKVRLLEILTNHKSCCNFYASPIICFEANLIIFSKSKPNNRLIGLTFIFK